MAGTRQDVEVDVRRAFVVSFERILILGLGASGSGQPALSGFIQPDRDRGGTAAQSHHARCYRHSVCAQQRAH